MFLDDLLCNVAVVGAAGKMGSGISALLVQELAELKINNPDKIYTIQLIDINEQGIDGLQNYIKSQMVKVAEKNIVHLRSVYEEREGLVENGDIINAYVDNALSVIRYSTELNSARNSKLVFEAAIENEDVKIKILRGLKKVCAKDAYYFTNTSSIPVGFLDKKVGLNGRIAGYHFYNPPIVQKLVEVIYAEKTPLDLQEISVELGKRLRKTLVPSNDIAGFIGNGHFIRDGLYAISEVERLSGTYSVFEAVYIINRITHDFLIRPMGIFQLIDYVGIDVFTCILTVMNKHLNDASLISTFVSNFVDKGIVGGQRPDGSQKDGFLKYEKGKPVGIYDSSQGSYIDFGKIQKKIDPVLGDDPSGCVPWKVLIKDPQKEEKLKKYFENVCASQTQGAQIAKKYLIKSKEIGTALVENGIAASAADVNRVLMNGFYWIYGPVNDYTG